MKGRGKARDLANVLLGACLVAAPWVFGMAWATKGSANATLAGVFLVEATLLGVVLGECRPVRWAKTALGAWLLASPLALGFPDLAPSLAFWIVGALVLASADTARTAFDLANLFRSGHLRYRALTLTPERLIKPGLAVTEEPTTPERLARRITDSSNRIHRTLLGRASGPEVDLCAMGYRACAEDLVSLADLVRRESGKSGALRRLRLRAALRRAAEALSRARESFPTETLSVSREK